MVRHVPLSRWQGKNIRTKSLGSNNKQNVVLATIEGLKEVKTPEEVAKLRGKSIEEILG